MVNKSPKQNKLIKRKNLVEKIKKSGINRTTPEALSCLEDYIERNLIKIIEALKEEITTKGRKTLQKGDIRNVLDKLKNKNKNSFEV